MTRSRSVAASLLLALAALLLLPGTASATTTADVATALLSDPVYVDAKATASIDADRVRAAIRDSSRQIYVAVLPAAAASANGGASGVTTAIGSRLGLSAVLFTVSGTTLAGGAGSGSGLQSGEAGRIASSNAGGDLTAALVASVEQASSAESSGSSGSGGSGFSSSGNSSSGSGSGLAVLGVLGLLFIGGGGFLYSRSRRRRQQSQEGSRADLESLYGRLGADVSTLSPGDDAVARQALADAAERYGATGALMSKADSPGEWAAARRTVVEGLTAARLVRTRLGLDPGPEVPPPPSTGEQLQGAQRVQVGDQEYEGSPSYQPGRQHYFGGGYLGGRMVPGGWYGVPFWESMLLGSALSGGLGGGGLFGGGGGYDRGYDQGVDDAQHGGGGGGWFGGGGGSGDWGGGGGGGGGDWGGGGGDGGGGGSW